MKKEQHGESIKQLVRDRLSIVLSQVRFDARSIIGNYPRVYFPLLRWKRGQKKRRTSGIVDQNTEIVIEGFPRSGNTFTHTAFEFAQGRPVRAAHHLHVAAHVIEATRLKVPTVVIVRCPRDAVVALKLMYPDLSLDRMLKGYVRYHRAILPYLDACVVATFDQVTSDLGAVTLRVNEKYGTAFARFRHTEENVGRVFAILESVAYARIPSRTVIGTIPDRPSQREMQRVRFKEAFDGFQATRDYKLAHELFDTFAGCAVR